MERNTFFNLKKKQKKHKKKFDKVSSNFISEYLLFVLVGGILIASIIFYKFDAHILMFGNTSTALGEYIRTVATILGGALIILGLWINNMRVLESVRQNNLAETTQINMRFKDASTLLGSDGVSSILSGIYALHQIAIEVSNNDSQKGYVNIIHDILSAYIRENTNSVKNEKDGKIWRVNQKPNIVIQTIMTVLFKNEEQIYSGLVTDLSDCVFEHINLENAQIENVDFYKSKFFYSDFRNTTFQRCFFMEIFSNKTDFTNSFFCDCYWEGSKIKNTLFVNSKIERTEFNRNSIIKTDFRDTRYVQVIAKNNTTEEVMNFNFDKVNEIN
ncbi:MAG: pentapeptide repeat-containing protein [Bacteroides sp.]|nr:pentapeptide repeat-containing protein [Bacteroides sp.]